MKKIVPLASILLISMAVAQPAQGQNVESSLDGDICDTRPDLCDGAPVAKKKKKPKRTPASASAAARAAAKADRELDIEGEFDEMSVEPMPPRESSRVRSRSARRPAANTETESRRPLRVTFESYLHSNAAHPAISRRPASMIMNQKAFVPPVVRTTITGSTLDQPAGTNATPPASNAPADPSAAPAYSTPVDPAAGGPLR